MKYARMLGLAALAALALMAVVGAASASANGKVCSTEGVGASCGTGHGNVYTGEIHAVNTVNAILTSGFATVTCEESTVQGQVTNGETGHGDLEALTFGKCTSNIGACTVVKSTASAAAPWTVTVSKTTAPNGKMEVSNVGGEFVCGGIKCIYASAKVGNGATPEIVVNGGETASVVAKGVPLTKQAGSSFFCSNTATWSGTYSVTTPDSLFIT